MLVYLDAGEIGFMIQKLKNLRARILRLAARLNWEKNLRKRGILVSDRIRLTGNQDGFASIECGEWSILEDDVTIWISGDSGSKPELTLSSRVFIGRNTYIGVYQPIAIGKNTIVGAYSYIISANHRYEDRTVPIRDQGFVGEPIFIDEDVWIGTHVVILPGVTIGRGAIVAAGSIVNRNIPAYEIWGGVPAKFIKERPA